MRSQKGEGISEIKNGALELVFRPSAALYDGRFANNGWLQEMPDPITRVTWDNVAVISPRTAAKLGVEDSTLVKLKYKGRQLEIPVYILPGQADGSVAVSLGYGRTVAGLVGGSAAEGVPPVGVDAYKLRTSDAMYFGTGLSVEPTGKKYQLATVQDHFAIDRVGREGQKQRLGELVREATLEEYKEHPDFAKHAVKHPPLESLWQEHEFEGHRWAMTIDLAKCTGCGACVVACVAENNVPVVGRERILRNREMHWLRVDRYFRGQRKIRKSCSSRSPASNAKWPPAKRSAPWRPRSTARKALTTWFTTAAWARATAAITARTKCGDSTSSTTINNMKKREMKSSRWPPTRKSQCAAAE